MDSSISRGAPVLGGTFGFTGSIGCGPARVQPAYPAKPIQMLISTPAGASDIVPRKLMPGIGVVPVGSTSATFAAHLADATAKWLAIAPKLGIQKQ